MMHRLVWGREYGKRGMVSTIVPLVFSLQITIDNHLGQPIPDDRWCYERAITQVGSTPLYAATF
jgi:hypothetical protein